MNGLKQLRREKTSLKIRDWAKRCDISIYLFNFEIEEIFFYSAISGPYRFCNITNRQILNKIEIKCWPNYFRSWFWLALSNRRKFFIWNLIIKFYTWNNPQKNQNFMDEFIADACFFVPWVKCHIRFSFLQDFWVSHYLKRFRLEVFKTKIIEIFVELWTSYPGTTLSVLFWKCSHLLRKGSHYNQIFTKKERARNQKTVLFAPSTSPLPKQKYHVFTNITPCFCVIVCFMLVCVPCVCVCVFRLHSWQQFKRRSPSILQTIWSSSQLNFFNFFSSVFKTTSSNVKMMKLFVFALVVVAGEWTFWGIDLQNWSSKVILKIDA